MPVEKWRTVSYGKLERLSKQMSPAGAYAKIAISVRDKRGVKLTYHQCMEILYGDNAVAVALDEALAGE